MKKESFDCSGFSAEGTLIYVSAAEFISSPPVRIQYVKGEIITQERTKTGCEKKEYKHSWQSISLAVSSTSSCYRSTHLHTIFTPLKKQQQQQKPHIPKPSSQSVVGSSLPVEKDKVGGDHVEGQAPLEFSADFLLAGMAFLDDVGHQELILALLATDDHHAG